jgi:hypothetical protein
VRHYESADRTGKSHQARANAILHEQYSAQLHQRKVASARRLAAVAKQVGFEDWDQLLKRK